VEQILDKRKPEVVRAVRAVEAIEQMDSAEARGLLQMFVRDSPNDRIASAATAALRRLERK
jgi:hypothetical protein